MNESEEYGLFYSRCEKILHSIKNTTFSMFILSKNQSNSLSQTEILHLYLFGSIITETIIFFCPGFNLIKIVAKPKYIKNFFKKKISCYNEHSPNELKFQLFNFDNLNKFKIEEVISNKPKNQKLKIDLLGIIETDFCAIEPQDFFSDWNFLETKTKSKKLKFVEISSILKKLLNSKDEVEINYIKNSSNILKNFTSTQLKQQLINLKPSLKYKELEDISSAIEETFSRNLEESGEFLELVKVRCLSYSKKIFLCTFIISTSNYHAGLSRTFFIENNHKIETEDKNRYQKLCEVHSKLISLFKTGSYLRDIKKKVLQSFKIPEEWNIEFKIFQNGLDLSEEDLSNPKGSQIEDFNSYYIYTEIGLKSDLRAICLGDTILINNNKPEILTNINFDFKSIQLETITEINSEKPTSLEDSDNNFEEELIEKNNNQNNNFIKKNNIKTNNINSKPSVNNSLILKKLKSEKSRTLTKKDSDDEIPLIKRDKKIPLLPTPKTTLPTPKTTLPNLKPNSKTIQVSFGYSTQSVRIENQTFSSFKEKLKKVFQIPHRINFGLFSFDPILKEYEQILNLSQITRSEIIIKNSIQKIWVKYLNQDYQDRIEFTNCKTIAQFINEKIKKHSRMLAPLIPLKLEYIPEKTPEISVDGKERYLSPDEKKFTLLSLEEEKKFNSLSEEEKEKLQIKAIEIQGQKDPSKIFASITAETTIYISPR